MTHFVEQNLCYSFVHFILEDRTSGFSSRQYSLAVLAVHNIHTCGFRSTQYSLPVIISFIFSLEQNSVVVVAAALFPGIKNRTPYFYWGIQNI